MMQTRVPWAVLLTSFALFLASLVLPAFTVEGSGGTWPGWSVLLFGAIGVFSAKPANLLWLCNPLLAGAWIVARERSPHAFTLAGLASVGAASFLLCTEVAVSEAGPTGYRIVSVDAGYWLWLASCLTLVAFGAYRFYRR